MPYKGKDLEENMSKPKGVEEMIVLHPGELLFSHKLAGKRRI
jgi:hypothetical protein